MTEAEYKSQMRLLGRAYEKAWQRAWIARIKAEREMAIISGRRHRLKAKWDKPEGKR